jgi:hypothetical protein
MSFPQKTFELMLFAYPRGFRTIYGPQMKQLFRDCRRDSQSRGRLNQVAFWTRMILDVLQAAPAERWDSFTKDDAMKNLKRDAIAFLACAVVIAGALLLLGYGRKHEVAFILMFGYALDAMAVAGVIGNLIVFLLVKVTRLNGLRIALWTMLIVHGSLLLIVLIIAPRVGGEYSVINSILAYVASFAFWFSLHWLWAKSKPDARLASSGV